mmetsp:Transcript_8502/g.18231  ORF Transcript_8502/g.18231 Transcript_8502/m.18231 type:complete len:112 (-) Transcript_8502:41-376(-)
MITRRQHLHVTLAMYLSFSSSSILLKFVKDNDGHFRVMPALWHTAQNETCVTIVLLVITMYFVTKGTNEFWSNSNLIQNQKHFEFHYCEVGSWTDKHYIKTVIEIQDDVNQ